MATDAIHVVSAEIKGKSATSGTGSKRATYVSNPDLIRVMQQADAEALIKVYTQHAATAEGNRRAQRSGAGVAGFCCGFLHAPYCFHAKQPIRSLFSNFGNSLIWYAGSFHRTLTSSTSERRPMKRCIAILTLTISVALCADEASAISPEMGLWLDLVDAGYTADEAFDIVEMVVGEDRSDPSAIYYSPDDPVFYSHHANIDRIWW